MAIGNRTVERHLLERMEIYEESLRMYELGEIDNALQLLEANRQSEDLCTERACDTFLYDYLKNLPEDVEEPLFDLT